MSRIFKPERVRDFRDFLGVDDRYSHAHWLVQHNGGAFLPPWGKVEQWLLSPTHPLRHQLRPMRGGTAGTSIAFSMSASVSLNASG